MQLAATILFLEKPNKQCFRQNSNARKYQKMLINQSPLQLLHDPVIVSGWFVLLMSTLYERLELLGGYWCE